jgi:hypothetical protein
MPRTQKMSPPDEKAVAASAPKRTRKAAAAPKEAKPRATARRGATKPAVSVKPFQPSEHYAEIAEAAYHLWLGRDGQPGSPEQDWLQAEAEVRRRYTSRSVSASAS